MTRRARAGHRQPMTQTIHLFSALPADGANPPREIHLVPKGIFRGVDGRGPYRVESEAAVIAASMTDGKLALDENHSTDLAAPRGEPAPARGWIVAMHARADGIWGEVEWTGSGTELMANRAYRGISPVLSRTRDGVVTRILRASLTNTPNLTLASLHSRETNMDLLTQLREVLALDKAADETAVLHAVGALKSKPDLHSAVAAAAGVKIGEGLSDAAVTDLIVAEVKSLHARASAATQGTQQMATQLATMETELHQMKSTAARAKAEQVIDKALAEGKPVRALRDHFIERHMADPVAVEKELSAFPSLHSGGIIVETREKAQALVSPDAPHAQIQAAANKYVREQKDAGVHVEYHAAVTHVTGGFQA